MQPKIIEKACTMVKKQSENATSSHWESGKQVRKPSKIHKSTLKKPQLVQEQSRSKGRLTQAKETIKTYSVKYLGIAKGQIGILSKRLPMPHRSYTGKYYAFPVQAPVDDEGPRPEEYNEQIVHTYSRPNALIPLKKKGHAKPDWKTYMNPEYLEFKDRFNRSSQPIIKAPANRTGVAGWKLTRPTSSVTTRSKKKAPTGKKTPSPVPQPITYTNDELEDYYNEPYLKYLANKLKNNKD